MEGLAELKVKESDRLAATAAGLVANGVAAKVDGDTLIVAGGKGVRGGGTVATHLDHRIAMAFLMLGLGAERPGHGRRRRHDRHQLPRVPPADGETGRDLRGAGGWAMIEGLTAQSHRVLSAAVGGPTPAGGSLAVARMGEGTLTAMTRHDHRHRRSGGLRQGHAGQAHRRRVSAWPTWTRACSTVRWRATWRRGGCSMTRRPPRPPRAASIPPPWTIPSCAAPASARPPRSLPASRRCGATAAQFQRDFAAPAGRGRAGRPRHRHGHVPGRRR